MAELRYTDIVYTRHLGVVVSRQLRASLLIVYSLVTSLLCS